MKDLNCQKIPQTRHSMIPLLHYYDWGEASKCYALQVKKYY